MMARSGVSLCNHQDPPSFGTHKFHTVALLAHGQANGRTFEKYHTLETGSVLAELWNQVHHQLYRNTGYKLTVNIQLTSCALCAQKHLTHLQFVAL